MKPLELVALEKRVKELKEEIAVIEGQMRANHGEIQTLINNNPQIQMMNQANNRLNTEMNEHMGAIRMLEELIKLEKGDPDLPEEETEKPAEKEPKKKK